jgi:peptidoglycan/LPS O-acetylase OafA/YrhL
MGTTGNWVAIVFMATICGIFLASKVPLHNHSESANSSRLRWVGCVLAALAISMSLVFGARVVRNPLAFMFLPAFAGGVLLYSFPLSRVNKSTNLRWGLQWAFGGLAIAMMLIFGTRALHSPFIFITIPAIAGAVVSAQPSGSKVRA